MQGQSGRICLGPTKVCGSTCLNISSHLITVHPTSQSLLYMQGACWFLLGALLPIPGNGAVQSLKEHQSQINFCLHSDTFLPSWSHSSSPTPHRKPKLHHSAGGEYTNHRERSQRFLGIWGFSFFCSRDVL